MKKTILVCMAFVALTTMASCESKKSANKTFKAIESVNFKNKDLVKNLNLENAGDSLSYVYGLTCDNGLGAAIQSGVYPELKGFDSDEFIAGVVAAFETDTTQKFYDMGLMQGFQIKNTIVGLSERYGVEIDPVIVITALKQVVDADTTLLIPAEQANFVAQTILSEIEAKRAAENLAKGEAFLAEKAKEEGVQKTESGLLYKVLKPGSGEKVKADQQVTVSYTGTLIDGTKFDSNEKATFSVNGVVPGFGEGLKLMQKGGEYMLYIPAALGYGERGASVIPGNSVLVFEVKVLDIQ